jgi:hypothetical protein
LQTVHAPLTAAVLMAIVRRIGKLPFNKRVSFA